jgi:hypothetical protein
MVGVDLGIEDGDVVEVVSVVDISLSVKSFYVCQLKGYERISATPNK